MAGHGRSKNDIASLGSAQRHPYFALPAFRWKREGWDRLSRDV
jgi:hypothetical protein